jgi:acyl-CoA thioester hydrolase
MYSHTSKVKVRYGETDQMGVVYHGNYAQYFEIGRLEWLESLGISYKEMEKEGVILPVVSLEVSFKKPAYYDDVLSIKTTLIKSPNISIEFAYEITNSALELITKGYSKLVFVSADTKKPTRCPKYILDQIP